MFDLSLELLLIVLLAALLVLQTLRLVWMRGLSARRLRRNRERGEAGEVQARELLLGQGYEILEEQTTGGYTLLVDDEPLAVTLRADFIVRRSGLVHLAEVKAGDDSARAAVRATRRQLLEYLFAFDVDGLLLVDVPNQRVSAIRFPLAPQRSAARPGPEQGRPRSVRA